MTKPHFVVDCSRVSSVHEFWQVYLESIGRPEGWETFGNNLDALWDSLDAAGPGYPGPCVIDIRNLDHPSLQSLRSRLILVAADLMNDDISLLVS